MFKKLTLVLAIALLSVTCFAQNNFMAAKVTIKGKTQYGFIDYKNWASNPKTITFKSTTDGKEMSYDATQIDKFEVANETYVSAKVSYKNKKFVADAARRGNGPRKVNGTVFLRTLIGGEKSLYEYLTNGAQNFYIKNGSDYLLLEYDRVFVKDPETEQVSNSFTETKKYIGQLSYYLSGYKGKNKIKNASYTKSSLMAIFNSYYKNTNSSSSYQFEIEKSKAEFGIVAGGFYSMLSFSGDVFPRLTQADFSGSMGFAAGGFVEFTSIRDHGRSQFHLELLVNTSSFESTFTYNTNDYLPFEKLYNTEVSYTMLNFNSLYRYKIVNNDIQVFIGPGLGFGYLLSETNSSVITTVFESGPNQTVSFPIFRAIQN